MRAPNVAQQDLIRLYPPADSCGAPASPAAHQQRLVGLCYHHADLRARLTGGGPLDRQERLYLVRLELASRSKGEKRRYRRHRVELPAILQAGKVEASCLVVDVGPGGLGVVTATAAPPRQIESVRVLFPESPWLPVASFTIAWRMPRGDGHRVGLQIDAVPPYVLPAPYRAAEELHPTTSVLEADSGRLPGCPWLTAAPCGCLRRAIPWSTRATKVG